MIPAISTLILNPYTVPKCLYLISTYYNACSLSNLIIYFNEFGLKKKKKNVNVIANENKLWTKRSDHGIRYSENTRQVTP